MNTPLNVSIDITDAEFEHKVLQNEKPVMVFFYSRTCSSCKEAGPLVDEVARAFPDIAFFKVNCTLHEIYAQKAAVKAMPTMVLFEGGKMHPNTMLGAPAWQGFERMQAWIEETLGRPRTDPSVPAF